MIHLPLPPPPPYSAEFTQHRAMDPTTGRVAYRYLLPKGWKAVDQIAWNPAERMRPASGGSTLTSPDGAKTISILPGETFAFQTKDGQTQGTQPPENATSALKHVLSGQHPGVTNASIIFSKDLPTPTPFDGQPGLKTMGMVGIFNAAFEEGGVKKTALLTATEYFGVHQEENLTQGLTMMTQGYTISVKGGLSEEDYKLFGIVLASHRPDPTFFATVQAVSAASQGGGAVDVKAIAAGVKGLSDDEKQGYVQSVGFHSKSVALIVPTTVFPGLTEVDTSEGSLLGFKGLHVWTKKPDLFFISEGGNPPGAGWTEAKGS